MPPMIWGSKAPWRSQTGQAVPPELPAMWRQPRGRSSSSRPVVGQDGLAAAAVAVVGRAGRLLATRCITEMMGHLGAQGAFMFVSENSYLQNSNCFLRVVTFKNYFSETISCDPMPTHPTRQAS